MELASTEKPPTPIRHETIFVQPETPTALHGRETFKISDGNNMTIRFGLSSLHVVGGTLDPARFCSALSRTLQWFPTAAGRLKRVGDDWQIDLINDAVPVHLASSPSRHVLPHTSAEGDGDPPAAAHVVQPSSHVAPYLARVDPVAARKGEPNAHLCTFVLTDMGDGRTVIGLSWNQVLGASGWH
ncbi:hypothetical protein FA95DRAFT_1560541 [Auriscalpium vulgare]|uniref:Uncharacterized protein n=1 Tax=Auriscalpium vulgare TaxID=40419 RepID=A0ACB8RQ72_9AGAM|nr:hypothetical protein FA95DRAFT_1560541 [Auriscalpium vulgare]